MTVVVPLYRTTSRTVPWLSGKYQFTMPCGLRAAGSVPGVTASLAKT